MVSYYGKKSVGAANPEPQDIKVTQDGSHINMREQLK